MTSYDRSLDILELELALVSEALGSLSNSDWARPTLLEPPPGNSPWTLLELAGHLDISIGITTMLVEDLQAGSPERDAVDFFIFPVEAPADFYQYAYTMVDGKDEADLPGVLRATFATALRAARSTSPDAVGEFPGFEPYPLIRLDDWVSGRVVEAVVHGMDLTDALGRPAMATADGIAHTAHLLDDLLARVSSPGRPVDLADDLRWIRAAAGRDHHPDPRLPVIH
jgi:hypothetical protein